MNFFLDNLIKNRLKNVNKRYEEFIEDLFGNQSVNLAVWIKEYKKILKNYNILFKNYTFAQHETIKTTTNVFWGSQFAVEDNRKLLLQCICSKKKYVFAEMGFLHRIAFPSENPKYSNGISFMFDDIAPYYDARFPNRLETLLNDKNLIITEEQKQRARSCIDKIVSNHLTKYNHQPIFEPKIGQEGKRKVLVIDQSYGDMSISKGMANKKTFEEMLNCAITENPDADIIIKTHPDKNGGYYTKISSHDNIHIQTEPINPISLINYADKVYVCTSQFGFEALMCKKEVHIFGMPFYAGWGITIDNQKCSRRTNKRTLEEIFFIVYIMYSYYVNPEKNEKCEIEEALEYLLKLRNDYFKETEDLK